MGTLRTTGAPQLLKRLVHLRSALPCYFVVFLLPVVLQVVYRAEERPADVLPDPCAIEILYMSGNAMRRENTVHNLKYAPGSLIH
jgi:hypothetical protein